MSGANRAAAWLVKAGEPTPSVSVTAISTEAAFEPAYLAISERSEDLTPAIWEGVFSRSSVVVPPGYQWTMTKSIERPAMESTVLFQSAVSPGAFSLSGQKPGW